MVKKNKSGSRIFLTVKCFLEDRKGFVNAVKVLPEQSKGAVYVFFKRLRTFVESSVYENEIHLEHRSGRD